MTQPTRNLPEIVSSKLSSSLEGNSNYRRVIWWDSNGYLGKTVREVCEDQDWDFLTEDRFLLNLRQQSSNDPSVPEVWYIPFSKEVDDHSIDWFTDVARQGSEIQEDVFDLCDDLYGDALDRWDIRGLVDQDSKESVSSLIDLLSTPHIPDAQEIRFELLGQGDARNVYEILLKPMQDADFEEDEISELKTLLQEDGYHFATESESNLVEDVRKNAVACYLIHNGVNENHFSDRMVRNYKQTELYPCFTDVLAHPDLSEGSNVYMDRTYFSTVAEEIENLDDAVHLVLDRSIDRELWEKVEQAWDTNDGLPEELSDCVQERRSKIEELFYEPESLFVYKAWTLLSQLDEFCDLVKSWGRKTDADTVFQRYRQDNGDWQIDQCARRIMCTDPGNNIPSNHPAYSFLKEQTRHLLNEEYTRYLRETGEYAEQSLQEEHWGDEISPSFTWWDDHKESLSQDHQSMVFYIDALRMDLMKELEDHIADQHGLDVTPEYRIAPLPTVTSVGMGALTPPPGSFRVECQDGSFRVYKRGTRVDNSNKRKQQLEEEGFELVDGDSPGDISVEEEGTETRMAYFSREIDVSGHVAFERLESMLEERVERLAEKIKQVITAGGMEQVYVVTDHGFLLFPDYEREPDPVKIDPGDAEIVKPNFLAGDNLSDQLQGTLVDKNTKGFSYLDTELNVLFDPLKQYKKSGSGFERFTHGGGLPQECLLMFLKVEG